MPRKKAKAKPAGKPTVSFRYKISPNYSLIPVAGLYGGINAQGDIIASVYTERAAIPRITKHEISPDGKLSDPPIGIEMDENIIRDVLLGLAIKPHVARDIAEWLNKKADEFEKMAKAQEIAIKKGKKKSKK